MKFKATSDFRNTAKFKIDGHKDVPMHVAKGSTFEANVEDPATAEIIAILGHSGRIIDCENQPSASTKIDNEVEAEKRKSAELAKVADKK